MSLPHQVMRKDKSFSAVVVGAGDFIFDLLEYPQIYVTVHIDSSVTSVWTLSESYDRLYFFNQRLINVTAGVKYNQVYLNTSRFISLTNNVSGNHRIIMTSAGA